MGYGNGVDTFGKGGPSNVVEYDIATGGREARLIDGGCPVGGRRFRPGNFFKVIAVLLGNRLRFVLGADGHVHDCR